VRANDSRMPPARYWLGTCYSPTMPAQLTAPCVWLRGQQETCPTTGRIHWQVCAGFSRPVRLGGVKLSICDGHWEPTRSDAADEYVWKEATRIPGTQFELGRKPTRRNVSVDWDEIKASAQRGELDTIPSDIYIRYSIVLTSVIIGHCKQLLQTLDKLWALRKLSTCFGVPRALVKVSEHGKRQVWRLTLKIREPSGGTDIMVMKTLYSMNFEGPLTSRISSGGLTATQSVWSTKEVLDLSYVKPYGLPQIWLQTNGTLN